MKLSAYRLAALISATALLFPPLLLAAVPEGPSHVYTRKTRLIVQRRLPGNRLDEPRPYVIKGVTWSPATKAPDKGPNPLNTAEEVPYGFFFDWPSRNPPGHIVFGYWFKSQYLQYYKEDIYIMENMGVNTVRLYSDLGDDVKVYHEILDEFYRRGIMVIMSVALSKDDIDKKRYISVVDNCKEHPAILIWSIGNEWNLEYNKYWGYATVREAAAATNRVAYEIKKIDRYHPVSSCLGDRFWDDKRTNTVRYIVNRCRDVDVWGLNIYRGRSFTNLFKQWRKIIRKPMYLSEFGIDSFHTESYRVVDGFQADDCTGSPNERIQAYYALSLWHEISDNLSVRGSSNVCIGGTIHTFSDSLWKVGSYHAGLGGLVDYDDPAEGSSYKRYDTEGFYLPHSTPDDVANEEYFGLVTAERRPKKAFWAVRDLYIRDK